MYEDGALHLQTKSKKYGKLGALRINSAVNMSNHRDHFCGRVIEQAIGVCWVAAGLVNRVSRAIGLCRRARGWDDAPSAVHTDPAPETGVRDCHHYRLLLPHCC